MPTSSVPPQFLIARSLPTDMSRSAPATFCVELSHYVVFRLRGVYFDQVAGALRHVCIGHNLEALLERYFLGMGYSPFVVWSAKFREVHVSQRGICLTIWFAWVGVVYFDVGLK